MNKSDFHKIECVGCEFALFSEDIDLEILSQRFGVEPSACIRASSKRGGYWAMLSAQFVTSPDVNEHLLWLLSIVLPHKDWLLSVSPQSKMFFRIDWLGTYHPFWSRTPTISAVCISGIAELRAKLDVCCRERAEAP